MQVIDLCAGGGGKTLALAALMNNHGQIFATDTDTRRLAPIYDRLDRAGVRNVQVRSPKGKGDDPVADLEGKADLVVVDAPCTGTGTWRRNPDAKWRVRPGALEQRQKDQAAVLDRAADLVKKGGRIAYITCSLLPPENDDAVDGFLARHPGFTLEAVEDVARRAGLAALAQYRSIGGQGILLTPLRTKTDGFFFASLLRTD
jgi:16S rRNA (cytosine967-C5)-methyltransferase